MQFQYKLRILIYFFLIWPRYSNKRIYNNVYFYMLSISVMEIVNVEEMVAMFLHILVHNIKNRVI